MARNCEGMSAFGGEPIEPITPPKRRKPTRRRRRHKKKGTSKGPILIVLDHAIVRYYERVVGLNIREVEKEILTDQLREQHRKLGDGVYPIGNKFRVVIKHNEIVTVLPLEDYKNEQ